jgi:hypothetical protein
MRQRHIPRLCRSCRAPMARQEATCWRCGVEWASEAEPRNALRLIHGGASQVELDTGRWIEAGGSVGIEARQVARVVI